MIDLLKGEEAGEHGGHGRALASGTMLLLCSLLDRSPL